MIVTPERTHEQRMDALGHANEIRTARKQLKWDVKAGRRSVVAVLTMPPEYAENMKAFDLLMATPKYGRVKVSKALRVAQVSQSKTLGGLSVRQRVALAALLAGRS